MAQQIQRVEPQLCMRRIGFDDLPEIEVPDGYLVRTSREGDGLHWARILRESFVEDSFDEARFEREMRQHPAYRPDRIFLVCAPDGLPCATASAYRLDAYGPNAGCLHYVGVCPAHVGRRLGYAVSLAVLHKFRSEGLQMAVLQTDDFRLAAVKTYLRLGFSPLIVHESQPARWHAVFARLGLSALQEYACWNPNV
jgi:mycothiol synthase